jgi:hypothetical protein
VRQSACTALTVIHEGYASSVLYSLIASLRVKPAHIFGWEGGGGGGMDTVTVFREAWHEELPARSGIPRVL